MPTRREILVEYLRSAPHTSRELAELCGMRVRDVIDDLEHIRRSHRRDLVIEPAKCSQCDFVFRKRDKLGTPSRCPTCRNERIRGPWLHLRQRP